ncbi:MAG: hypothetical protein JEY96_02420 [Bacteroidales bacterium]|nr:hypothetical protein [Bacteroidales bacterium]
MIQILFNPFKYIAGIKSLLLGIAILIATSILAFYTNIHFPDVISVKSSSDFPYIYYLIQCISNWIVVSIVFYIIAILASPSKIRIVDIFGTQALSRFPYLIATLTGFSTSLDNFEKYIYYTILKTGEFADVTDYEIIISILIILFTLALTIWFITLMFNAFRTSANIKGVKSVILFIAGLLVSIIITSLITNQLIQII